jgi:hypothetical protein
MKALALYGAHASYPLITESRMIYGMLRAPED